MIAIRGVCHSKEMIGMSTNTPATPSMTESPSFTVRWPASKRRMGIGVMLPIAERSAFGTPVRFADMVEMAQVAEAAGYDAIWLADHFIFRPPVAPEGEEYGPWEAWTAAAALAQATSTINIGLLVSCLGWRNPGIVARMTETIDEVSNGRFILGTGAGWHEPEYEAFGFPFDHRVGRFEDAITIVSQLLRTGQSNHDGRFFQTTNAVSRPRGPLAAVGGAPILVGTSGPRMLQITARYADAWNTVWHKEASATVKDIAAIEAACAEVGRDPSTLVKTAGGNIALPGYTGTRGNAAEGDIDQLAAGVAAFRDLGFSHFVAGIDPCTPASLEYFARVIEVLDR
jgi:alkanesulfonate monooxygenase SsuD/methylene tetrahydromethanopterin reductase-like flavin-dependent oxidoreductase (luciferase family)